MTRIGLAHLMKRRRIDIPYDKKKKKKKKKEKKRIGPQKFA